MARPLRYSLRALGGAMGAQWERERRDTLFLMVPVLASVLPHLPHIPAWAGLAFAVLFGWRFALVLSGRWLPRASVRWVAAIGCCTAVYAQYGTLFGREPGVVLLVLFLGVKLMEMQARRDLFVVIFLCFFLLLTTFFHSQSIATAAVVVVALYGLLAAMLTMQYRRTEASIATRMRVVASMVAQALPLALVAFLLFPRAGTPLWGTGADESRATTGLSDSMTIGNIAQLGESDAIAFRVQFEGATPPNALLYWRGPVFGDFDGRTWRMARDLRFFPPPKLAVEADGWDYQVDLEPTDNRQLIALDLPTRMPEGTWTSLDYTVWAGVPQHNVSRWRMRSAPAVEDAPALHPRLRSRALALPPGFNPRTLALGRQWRREAGTDPRGAADRAIAQRALALIRRDFAYTLDVPLSGRNEVDDFLFERREGYCEHFSSAFTVLMRAAGVPARVVTGYAGGYRNPVGGYWLVRKSDAHAWVEIWLPDRGWTRVDPTAAVAPENVYDTIADRQPGRIGNLTALVPVFNASDWLRRGWNDFVLGFNAQRQQALLSRLGIGKLDPRQLVALFALVAAMSLAAMAWTLARGERERDPLLRAWHALERRYRRIDRGRRPHEPALEWARRVAADSPRAGEHLLALAQRFSDARYAPPATIDRQPLLRALARHRP